MPTYEYRCTECGEQFEQPEHIEEHEKSHPKCPACGSKEVSQTFSSFFAKTSRKS